MFHTYDPMGSVVCSASASRLGYRFEDFTKTFAAANLSKRLGAGKMTWGGAAIEVAARFILLR